MKADLNDAPEWIKSKSRKRASMALAIPLVIGAVIAAGAFYVNSQSALLSHLKNLAQSNQQPAPIPIAEIHQTEPETDWDKVVEQQAHRDAILQQKTEQPEDSEPTPVKQTVFNDQNYIPRGADNVLSLNVPDQPPEQEKPKQKMTVTIIEQTPSMKDRACWPHKEGSIEQRNCRADVGLKNRN
jgi:hypothetical protein